MKNEPLVQRQYAPYYIVKSFGTCIDYTDDHARAHDTYRFSPASDKSIYRIDEKGIITCLKRMLKGKELGKPAVPDPSHA